MTDSTVFEPRWASAPGATILDILQAQRVAPEDFAKRIGRTLAEAEDLLSGREPITSELAQQLAHVIGPSEGFWLRRESQYRQDLARLEAATPKDAALNWLKEVPLRDMKKFGWVDPTASELSAVAECLSFFGVGNVAEWRSRYAPVLQSVAFRISPSFESDPGAVAAWLRMGELKAATIDCEAWDLASFKRLLISLRSLTREKDPSIFVPELVSRCADCGVAIVILRAPAKCRASGVARVLPGGRRMILLSVRYLSEDQFWFTFFHEAAHLVLHSDRSVVVDVPDFDASKEEVEANDFAANLLIPRQHRSRMRHLGPNSREIMRFAREIGISPGIVVGQLQHSGQLRHNQMNRLKRRYEWQAESD